MRAKVKLRVARMITGEDHPRVGARTSIVEGENIQRKEREWLVKRKRKLESLTEAT